MRRNTAELKEKLIQTGIEEIKGNGIDKLSLRTVAKVCGVTHGSPYKHFDSKDGYLRAVLGRLSQLFNEEVTKNLREDSSAKQQLVQMGVGFVSFAQTNPYIFEALFIKYPFNYMDMTAGTIVARADLPGFDSFKKLIIKLRQEEGLAGAELDTLIHFWSFIAGLSILAINQIGENASPETFQESIEAMLDIYIKGGKS